MVWSMRRGIIQNSKIEICSKMMRWKPVNPLKNSHAVVQIRCSGSRYNVPTTEEAAAANEEDYLLGSTTLQELVRRVERDMPALYLWDREEGGQVGGDMCLSCGPNQVCRSEWDKTMIWELICEKGPRVVLEDGREAVVFTITGRKENVVGGDDLNVSTQRKYLAKGSMLVESNKYNG